MIDAAQPPRIALIGFGEAARAFVSGWPPCDTIRVAAFGIKTRAPGGAPAMRDAFAAHGVAGADTPAAALDGAGTVFSLVTADQARAAA